MYCGDETGAFIGDVGSHTSRFGYGGEDNPKHVVPSFVGKNGNNKNNKRTCLTTCYNDYYDTVTPAYRQAATSNPWDHLQQGDMISDWDAYEELWQGSFDVLRVRDTLKHTKGASTATSGSGGTSSNSAGGVTSSTVRATSANRGDATCGHPLLAVSHGNTHVVQNSNDDAAAKTTTSSLQYQAACRREEMAKITEILLESLQAPACFVAPTPMLDAFCHGRQTCLVVDIGAGGTRVTPVVDGLLLKHAQRRNGRGGEWLGQVQLKALEESKIHVVPRYQCRQSSATSKSTEFHRWAMLDVMYEFRTSHFVTLEPWRKDTCTMPFENMDTDAAMAPADNENENSCYELPDGTMIDLDTPVGKDLCRIPELFFTDKVPFVENENTAAAVQSQSDTLSNLPLPKLIQASLTAVGDAEARKELCGNIVLCGASSLFDNLDKRLSYELTNLIPATHKCRVIASRQTTERSCAAWIGGSVLTSLGSFQQLWLSKTEYEEYGATLAIQRFP